LRNADYTLPAPSWQGLCWFGGWYIKKG
jgi:hypothetical protein